MAEKSEDMGAVTHQLSAVDDDMNKHANVKEANVASVALSKSKLHLKQEEECADSIQPLLSRQRSRSYGLGA